MGGFQRIPGNVSMVELPGEAIGIMRLISWPRMASMVARHVRGRSSMSDPIITTAPKGTPIGEISQAPPAFEMFLDRHQLKLIVLALLIALLAVAYVVWKGVRESGEETAGQLLSAAESSGDLAKVIDKHADTPAAHSARILLAEKQWQDGKQNESIATLRSFVGGDLDHPARPSAMASLASKLLAKNEIVEARDLFKKITADPDAEYIAPYAWIAIGDIDAAEGKPEEAEKAYQAVERDFPGSAFVTEALNRRLLLKASAPVEIAPKIVVPETNLSGAESPAPDLEGGIPDLLNPSGITPDNNRTNPLLEGRLSTPEEE